MNILFCHREMESENDIDDIESDSAGRCITCEFQFHRKNNKLSLREIYFMESFQIK